MHYERSPARAWLTTAVVFVAVAVVAGLFAVVAQLPALWVLVVFAGAVALPCLLHVGLAPSSVTADPDGVQVSSRWRTRQISWAQLRRVRRAGAGIFPRRGDLLLERTDGTLVPLPPELPGGAVEGWRERVGAGRPPNELPQTWRRYDPALGLWPLYAAPLAGQLPLRLIESERDWVFIAILASLLGVAVALLFLLRRRPPEVVADHTGLVVRGLRQRRIAWSEVLEVRPVDRFDSTAVVVLADGKTRTLLDVPADVAKYWRTLAVQART